MPPRKKKKKRQLIVVNTNTGESVDDALERMYNTVKWKANKHNGDLKDLQDIVADFVENGVPIEKDKKDLAILELEKKIKKHKKEIAKLKKERRENKKTIKELKEENHKLKEDYNRFDILDIRE